MVYLNIVDTIFPKKRVGQKAFTKLKFKASEKYGKVKIEKLPDDNKTGEKLIKHLTCLVVYPSIAEVSKRSCAIFLIT